MSRSSCLRAPWLLYTLMLAALVSAACSPGRSADQASAPAPPADVASSRPLVMYTGKEPASVATRALLESNLSLRTTQRMFNALPALLDGHGVPQPELLASLPTLNSGDWQVFPDGTMQTTYTLRTGLTWHDGQPLTADDFVFSWRVYASPELGRASQQPMQAIAEVASIDATHFTIRWKTPYPDADTLSKYGVELPALPKHILGPTFEQLSATGTEPLVNHPFWGPEYAGLGPYRVQQWAAGSYLDAVRFEEYALGVPRIARIQLRFSVDQNVVIASLLAGEAQAAGEGALPDVPEGLAGAWSGTVLQYPRSLRLAEFQLRPELANPPAILNPHVRQAIAYSVDKQGMSAAAYGG